MEPIEFEVQGNVPPKNVGTKSMWNNETEIPRVIQLRKSALEALKGKKLLTKNIRLGIEIHIPENLNKLLQTGDLDNFIKGICDSLYVPKVSLENPNFPIHEHFGLPDNKDIHPRTFKVIEDDGQIVEIHARRTIGESGHLYYKIRIEGE